MVTDEEMQRIIDENEAGVGDLMETYELIEQHYFASVSSAQPVVITSGSNSTPL